mgnify:CR=1 FL=1
MESGEEKFLSVKNLMCSYALFPLYLDTMLCFTGCKYAINARVFLTDSLNSDSIANPFTFCKNSLFGLKLAERVSKLVITSIDELILS